MNCSKQGAFARRAIGTAALITTLLIGFASPALSWGAPSDISTSGSSFPQVAMNAAGEAVIVWVHFDGSHTKIQVRPRSAAGTLGTVKTISGVNAVKPQVGINSSGDALVVWQRDFENLSPSRIEARTVSQSGTLGPIQTLSVIGEQSSNPQVAVNPTGDALIVWVRNDGMNSRIQARARSAAGVLSARQTLSPGGHDAVEPQVAINDNGDGAFTWRRHDGSFYRVQAMTRSAAGTLGTAKTLSPAGDVAQTPQIAITSASDAVIVWTQSSSTNGRVATRKLTAGGTLGAYHALTTAESSSPQISFTSSGFGYVAWLERDNMSILRIMASHRGSSGSYGVKFQVSCAQADNPACKDQPNGEPQIAVNAAGRAVVVWPMLTVPAQIQSRSYPIGGAPGSLNTFEAPAVNTPQRPQVAVGDSIHAFAVWELGNGANNTIRGIGR